MTQKFLFIISSNFIHGVELQTFFPSSITYNSYSEDRWSRSREMFQQTVSRKRKVGNRPGHGIYSPSRENAIRKPASRCVFTRGIRALSCGQEDNYLRGANGPGRVGTLCAAATSFQPFLEFTKRFCKRRVHRRSHRPLGKPQVYFVSLLRIALVYYVFS